MKIDSDLMLLQSGLPEYPDGMVRSGLMEEILPEQVSEDGLIRAWYGAGMVVVQPPNGNETIAYRVHGPDGEGVTSTLSTNWQYGLESKGAVNLGYRFGEFSRMTVSLVYNPEPGLEVPRSVSVVWIAGLPIKAWVTSPNVDVPGGWDEVVLQPKGLVEGREKYSAAGFRLWSILGEKQLAFRFDEGEVPRVWWRMPIEMGMGEEMVWAFHEAPKVFWRPLETLMREMWLQDMGMSGVV